MKSTVFNLGFISQTTKITRQVRTKRSKMNKSLTEESRKETIQVKEQANVMMETQQGTNGGSKQVNISLPDGNLIIF